MFEVPLGVADTTDELFMQCFSDLLARRSRLPTYHWTFAGYAAHLPRYRTPITGLAHYPFEYERKRTPLPAER